MATSDAIEIPFLGEWSQLRRERRELRERLAKLEYEQGRFSESVLARVRIDYERKIHDLESRSVDLAERARREMSSLAVAVDQQESEVKACRLGIEEFDLREKLGEQLDAESAERAAEGRAELGRLEDDLRAMRELLERVRRVADGHTGGSAASGSPIVTGPLARIPQEAANEQQAVEPGPRRQHLRPLPPSLDGALPPHSHTEPIAVIAVPRLVPTESADSNDHFALKPRTLVGRTAECDLRLPVGTVSRRHAELEWTEEGWRIRDLQSENGSWVNGERAFDRLLVDGDRLQFGTVALLFKTT